MIIKAECPFCDWSARQEVDQSNKAFQKAYMAKALISHLHLNHARHDAIKDKETNIAVSTIMGMSTQQGMVELSLNNEVSQMDLDKARLVHRMLGEAIEAAVSDWMIYRFFTEKIGFDQEKASRVLMDFRELRQGSKDEVNPS